MGTEVPFWPQIPFFVAVNHLRQHQPEQESFLEDPALLGANGQGGLWPGEVQQPRPRFLQKAILKAFNASGKPGQVFFPLTFV